MSNLKQVLVIAGDGIGREVIGETRRALDRGRSVGTSAMGDAMLDALERAA